MVAGISTGELLLITGVVALMCYLIWRRFFRTSFGALRSDALVYDAKYIKSSSTAREAKYASHLDICGVQVGSGEEVEALDNELYMLDDIWESEGEFKAGVEQLRHFIGPANGQLAELYSDQINGDQYFSYEELEELIEEAEVAIAEAEWMVANPQDALAQWEEER